MSSALLCCARLWPCLLADECVLSRQELQSMNILPKIHLDS